MRNFIRHNVYKIVLIYGVCKKKNLVFHDDIHDDDVDKTHIHVSDPILRVLVENILFTSLVQIIIHSLVNTTLSHIFHGNNIFPNKVIQFQ